MGNSHTLERGVIYPVTNGPSAGELGPAVLRTVLLSFEVALPSGAKTQLALDITSIAKRKATVVGLFVVGIGGRISGDHSQGFRLKYDPHAHKGELRLL